MRTADLSMDILALLPLMSASSLLCKSLYIHFHLPSEISDLGTLPIQPYRRSLRPNQTTVSLW